LETDSLQLSLLTQYSPLCFTDFVDATDEITLQDKIFVDLNYVLAPLRPAPCDLW